MYPLAVALSRRNTLVCQPYHRNVAAMENATSVDMLKDLAIAASLLANVVLLCLLYFFADGNGSTRVSVEDEPRKQQLVGTVDEIGSTRVPVEDEPRKQQLVGTVNAHAKLEVGQEPALLDCLQQCETEDYQLMSTKLRDMKLDDEAIVRIVADMALLGLKESNGCRTLFNPEFRQNTFECFDQQRSMLVSIFGSEVKENHLFESLFFPVNDTLDFLSSDDQIEVARLERELTTRLKAIPYAPQRSSQREEVNDHIARSVQELLSTEDYDLYRFRRSNTGRLLRSGYQMEDFFSSEAEFLEVFLILEEEESPELAAIRLQDYFGHSRYVDFQKRRDPVYKSMKAVGDHYGLTDQLVVDVYQTQIELRELADRLERDGVPQKLRWKEIQDQLPGIKAELEHRTTTEVADILTSGLLRGIFMRSY